MDWTAVEDQFSELVKAVDAVKSEVRFQLKSPDDNYDPRIQQMRQFLEICEPEVETMEKAVDHVSERKEPFSPAIFAIVVNTSLLPIVFQHVLTFLGESDDPPTSQVLFTQLSSLLDAMQVKEVVLFYFILFLFSPFYGLLIT